LRCIFVLHIDGNSHIAVVSPITFTMRRLYIRGDETDDAVLCTDSETYNIREVQVSNSLLLAKGTGPSAPINDHQQQHDDLSEQQQQQYTFEVHTCFSSYLELQHTRPKLERLRDLLMQAPYTGSLDQDIKIQRSGLLCGKEDLLERVQCSEDQLGAALENLGAVLLDGE
jgi:sister chromatid cohesion protein DCC1